MKSRAGNFFEDFRVGQRIVHGTPRTITAGDCALYLALTGARHVVHCAQPVAHALWSSTSRSARPCPRCP
jgi:2-methylfumaryl-CoA hydratase